MNNKGFSMVELLAVIVILGVISTIGIVAVTRLVDNSRKHYYETQESTLVMAAQSYARDNPSVLPKVIGAKSKITLDTLYKNKYITDEIVDQNKRKCDALKTYVNVYKYSKTDYRYKGYLNCPSCEDESGYCYKETSYAKPTIDIKLPSTNQGNSLYDDTTYITLTMKANGDNALISSYSYKIYVDNILKFNSGDKRNNRQAELTINEKLVKYLPGKVKVVATITNTDGESRSYSKSQDYTDNIFPACGKISYEGANAMNSYESTDDKNCGDSGFSWIRNGTRQAWIVCNDLQGIGCMQHEFSSVLSTEGANENIMVKDRNGYERPCRVLKCIDNSTPRVVVKIYKAPSGDITTNTDGTIKGLTADKTFTVNSRTSNSYSYEETYDVWLNKANYPDGVIVETIVDDDLAKIKTFSWYQNADSQKEGEIGSLTSKVNENSNVNKSKYAVNQLITKDGVRKQKIVVSDEVGNTITYYLTIKIDRTLPSCSNTLKHVDNNGSNYTSGTWTNTNVYTSARCSSDAMSGCDTDSIFITTSGATTNVTNKKVASWTVQAEGRSTTTYTVKDIAGNSKKCDEETEKIDKTAPSCSNTVKLNNSSGSNYTSGTWTKNNVYTSATCSETTGSLCKSEEVYITTTGETRNVTNEKQSSWTVQAEGESTTTYKVYDNAGNAGTCSTITEKIDKTAPTCSNTIKLNDSSGSNYTGGSWTKNNVYTSATCSETTGSLCKSGEVYITTTGKTRNVTDEKYTSWTVKAEGESTTTYKVYDNAGNAGTCSTITEKIDRTDPTCTNIAKHNNSSGSNYTSGSWTGDNIYTSATCSETAGSLCKSGEIYITTTGATANVTDSKESSWTVAASGVSTTTYKVYDNAGNAGTCSTVTEKKDGTPPTITITSYKKPNSTDLSSSNGLTSYTNGGWVRYAFIEATVSDNVSNASDITVTKTVTGASNNVTNVEGSFRNVNAEGESVVSFTATDKYGNSATESVKVRLDRTPPKYTAICYKWGKWSYEDSERGTLYMTFEDVRPTPNTSNSKGKVEQIIGHASDDHGNGENTNIKNKCVYRTTYDEFFKSERVKWSKCDWYSYTDSRAGFWWGGDGGSGSDHMYFHYKICDTLGNCNNTYWNETGANPTRIDLDECLIGSWDGPS